MVKKKADEHVSESTIVLSLIILIAVIVFGYYFFNGNREKLPESNLATNTENCEFPDSATDLREAGLNLSEQVAGTVGYSKEGYLTVESTNGFVLLTPVNDQTHIDNLIRDHITQIIGCEGASEHSYWVFEVSDPAQLPPEMLRDLNGEQPEQILVVFSTMRVFSVSRLTNPNEINVTVNSLIQTFNLTRSRSSTSPASDTGSFTAPTRSRTGGTGTGVFSPDGASNIQFTNNQSSNINGPTFNTALFAPPTRSRTESEPGTDTSGGSTSGGGRPVASGGGGGAIVPGSGSGSDCTLLVFCEDPDTGDRFTPGASGCYGADFYAQTPTPPTNTRQISQCVGTDGTTGSSCPDDYWFHFRNCIAEANSINIGGSGAIGITPETYDTIASGLPTNSNRGEPGTLFTVPATYGASPVNYTIRCSYPDQTVAIQCGMPGSGEYCLPGYNPEGCI